MKVFLIIFALAILFVVGTASAMRYFGDKSIKKAALKVFSCFRFGQSG